MSHAAPAISLQDFETGAIDVAAFDHEAHLYVAWLMVKRYPVLEAMERYSNALVRITSAHGVPEKYHQTITWFYLLVISERVAQNPTCLWPEFIAKNRDLLSRQKPFVQQYYRAETLKSDEARSHFLLPDLKIHGAGAGNPA